MKERILDFIVCPDCKRELDLQVLFKEAEQIKEGLLICSCGEIYPIVDFIPRIFHSALNEQPDFLRKYNSLLKIRRAFSKKHREAFCPESIIKTKRSFGYQWTRKMFSQIIPQFKNDFLNYISPVPKEFFRGQLCMDAGCGFGRHLYYAAKFGAEVIGVDLSKAIDSAYKNTKELPGVHLIQADIYNLPLRDGIFDFVYSIGVLHHLPDPQKGLRALLPLIKPKGSVSIWVYSKARPVTNFMIEFIRFITKKIPFSILYLICLFVSGIEWLLVIVPYKFLLIRLPLIRKVVENIMFPRIKIYSLYPFTVIVADWFDRLSAPIRNYYSEGDLKKWFSDGKLHNVKLSATGKYGWRVSGEKLSK